MSRIGRERRLREEIILDAAEALFRRKGFEGTQMDEIAAAAELSKTTVYKTFRSKDELAIRAYQRLHTTKMGHLRRAVEAASSPEARLRALGLAYREFFRDHPDYLGFQVEWDARGLDRDRVDPAMLEAAEEFIADDAAYLAAIVADGAAAGVFRSDLPADRVLDLVYLTLRTVLNQILVVEPGDRIGSFIRAREQDYDVFLDILIAGLRP